jgi:thiamine biosynthesis lipoprotein
MRNAVQEVTEVRLAQYVMGTVVEIMVNPVRGEEDARRAAASALHELERIERVFSRFDAASELSRVNREASIRPVMVSEEFFALTARGLEYSRHSAGAFSITLEPLVRLWESSAAAGGLPNQRQIDLALTRCDPHEVILDAKGSTVRFSSAGAGLNFDGLAKGYAADRAREILVQKGFSRAMINAGSSSIAVIRPDSDVSPWHVALRHPSARDRFVARLALDYIAMSTSGTGERGFRIQNQRFSHVIDPNSGLPVEESGSATALGDYAELMEVASKVLLLRGCRKGLRICERFGWCSDGVTVRETARDGELAMEYPENLWIEIAPGYDANAACAQ